MRPRRIVSVMLLTALLAVVVGSPPATHASTETVVVQWNAAALEASRRSTM